MARQNVDIDLSNLNNWQDRLQDLDAFLGEAGAYMEQQTKENFLKEQTPEGNPWPDLAESTLAQKRSGTILRETATLFNSITFEKRSDSVVVGPIGGPDYAIYHQLGTDKMPAREYLGAVDSDVEAIKQIALDYLND